MNIDSLLFSVGVLTYNSENTIIETLESIRDIEYDNIELIISDDCSCDSTLDMCKHWLAENGTRFKRTCLLSVDRNTFTSANCNRALNECEGDWVCLIAGDDVLYHDCILKVVKYIHDNPSAEWIVGKYNKFSDSCTPENFIKEGLEFNENWKNLFSLDFREQYKLILSKNFIYLPTAFNKRQTLLEVGGYDEQFGILEDYPMNIKLLKNGYKCFLLDDYIMGYRIGTLNISNNRSKLFNITHMRERYKVVVDYCFDHYDTAKKLNEKVKILIYNSLYSMGLDRSNGVNRALLLFLLKLNNFIFRGRVIDI